MNKKLSSISITVLICTANRGSIVLDTINSIRSICLDVPIVVVDNNSNGLPRAIKDKMSCFPNLESIPEPNPGLSIARNIGINSISTDWILFLDDDVLLPEEFFEKSFSIIINTNLDCFGGMYFPWYPEGKPVWLANDFGRKIPLLEHTGPIDVHKHGFITACIMCVKREALEAVGGFRTDLGMTQSIGYGEEDDLQIRLQAAGYRLGFVPDWWLYHAVLAHKHQVSWHLKSAYAHGRDGQRINQKKSKKETLARLSLVLLTLIPKRIPIALYRLFFKSDFYWQNAILYMFNPIAECLGVFMGTKWVKKK